jgi:hypothetical protein
VKTYAVILTGRDESHYVRYKVEVTDQYRTQVLSENLLYDDAMKLCDSLAQDDDRYLEIERGNTYCNISGRELHQTRARVDQWDAEHAGNSQTP